MEAKQAIADWIAVWASSDRVAFRFEGDTTTYAEFARRIDDVAHGLVAMGIEPGDRVGFCGLNRIEIFEVLFGCARLGAILVPFNNRLTASELTIQIADARPSLLLATDGFESLLTQAAQGHAIRDLDADPFDVADSTLTPRDFSGEVMPPETTLLMMYTSGTTGQAKGAMLSHDAVVHAVSNAVDYQELTAQDCIVASLPTFHVGGINVQTLPALSVGAEVILMRRFDPAEVLALTAKHQVTQMVLVPAMLAAVAAQPAFDATDLTSVVGIVSGSSIVPAGPMQPFFDRGIPVGQMYGLTETGPTAIALGYAEAAEHIGSCGKPSLHTEMRIVDETGADVDVGESGEIWVRGPNIFSGYWDNPVATAAAFADGGWFRTGDVGFETSDGFVYISDRIKDVVISGGENIYPAEIEPILSGHPGIVEVSVIGENDEQWGEVPVAVVVLADGSSLDIDELREWCEGRIARFKQPRIIRVVDALPRTALGKVKKHELRR